jgi:hypothetical protein
MYEKLVESPNKLLYAIFNAPDIQHLLKQKHEQLLGEVRNTITQWLAEGQDHGEFDPTIPIEVLLDAFISIAFARMRSLLIRKRALPTPEATAILLRIFFRGIGVSGDEAR